MLGDDLKHSLGGGQDLGPSPFGQGGVERLDLRARGFLTGLDVATGGGKRGSRRFAGQSFRAVELIVSPAEFAQLRVQALERGFVECVAGPLVRSSYRAEQALNRNNAGLDNLTPVAAGT